MKAYVVIGGYYDGGDQDSVYTVRLSEKEAVKDANQLTAMYDCLGSGPDEFWIEQFDTDQKLEDILI